MKTRQLSFEPPIIAHRGASHIAPENTLLAFNKAIALGIKWIEFDVMQAACGTPIIFHDDTLERVTNGVGKVNDFPYSYLRTLNAGNLFKNLQDECWIPTLYEVIELLEQHRVAANLEIKALPGTEDELVQCVLAALQDFLSLHPNGILFSSFSIEALESLRAQSPDCLIGLLMHEWRDDWEVIANQLNTVSIHLNDEIVTLERARAIKESGNKLLCYTVNSPVRALELYSEGIDAVFSDVPDVILRELRYD